MLLWLAKSALKRVKMLKFYEFRNFYIKIYKYFLLIFEQFMPNLYHFYIKKVNFKTVLWIFE
ncbi:MAG: hypothetical protein CMC51_03750 [Flavobacteriaceae bacterium]|nr:hypothetical protein [Flavobacteriaceae bacterium]